MVNSVSEAASILGQIKTEKKAAASRANGAKSNGRRPLRPLEEFDCICGENPTKHKARCPLWTAMVRRGLVPKEE